MNRKMIGYLLSMLRVGCVGFGGGSAMIPVIEGICIGDNKLDNKENYDKDIVVANLTPGSLTVKLAAALGQRGGGYIASMLGATAMALPGVVGTVLICACLASIKEQVSIAMDIIVLLISVAIILLIIHHIKRVIQKNKKMGKRFFLRSIVVIIGTFLLSCGSKLYNILNIEGEPLFSMSTFSILVYSIITIIIINVMRDIRHSICNRKINSNCRIKVKDAVFKLGRMIVKDVLVWILFILILSLPVIYLCLCNTNIICDCLLYFIRGTVSAIMSFGGGDAYLAVADGLFVNTAMISEEIFYQEIVSAAHMMPGSLLCKVLTAVGYSYGLSISGEILVGIAFALCGFAISISVSCSLFMCAARIYEKLTKFRSVHTLANYIDSIISGLLCTVILSLLIQCKASMLNLYVYL